MLQANSVARVRHKLFVRDFSYLQPWEVITIFKFELVWKIEFMVVENIGGDIFKADSAQSKRTTFLPKRELA